MDFPQRIKEYFSDPSAWFFNVYILGGTLLLLVFAFIFINILYPAYKKKHEKSSLFKHLSDLNRLSAQEAKMLYRMAGQARMEEPAMMFVKRSAFEDQAHTMGPADLVDAVRRKIYQ